MKAISTCVALLGLGFLADTARADDPRDLQGAWDLKGLAITRRSDAFSEFQQTRVALRVAVAGDQIEFRGMGRFGNKDMKIFFGTELVRGTFRLAPQSNPKGITLTRVVFSKGGVSQQVIQLGIYELKDGKLMLYLAAPGSPAPAAFAHQRGAEYLWLSGRRVGTEAVAGTEKGNAGQAPSPPQAPDPTRDPIVGKWTWFDGKTVTINPDGTLEHEAGNRGTWNIQDRPRRVYTLRWLQGNFVDTVTVSEDGQNLSGPNQGGTAVSARKLPETSAPPPPPQPPAPLSGLAPGADRPAPDFDTEQLCQRGLALDAAENDAAALPGIREAARRSHPRAQCVLGNMYLEGLGVPIDKPQAVSWFCQSADQGNRAAQFQLGVRPLPGPYFAP